MIRTTNNRRTAGIVALALALGSSAPAAAQPFQLDGAGSFVPAGSKVQQQASSAHRATTRHLSDSSFDWGSVALGSGAASLALIGIGGTVAAGRRQRRDSRQRPTIAA